MTIILEEIERCFLCGATSEHTECISTNAFGSRDLDTRPPQMERATIYMWVQKCPSCGYCASNISAPNAKALEVVASSSYQKQRNSTEFPELANDFLCDSLIQENEGEYVSAGWSSLHAAWVCDDNNATVSAQKCRHRAIDLLQQDSQKEPGDGKKVGAQEALMVDLLRRTGQFEKAKRICEDGLKKKPKKLIVDILGFQKELISRSDISCHTIDDLTPNSDALDSEGAPPEKELLDIGSQWFRRNAKDQHSENSREHIKVSRYPRPSALAWRFDIPLVEINRPSPDHLHLLCPKSVSYADFYHFRVPTSFLLDAANQGLVDVTPESGIGLLLSSQVRSRFINMPFNIDNYSRFLVITLKMGDEQILAETKESLVEIARNNVEVIKALIELAKSDATMKYEVLELLEDINCDFADECISQVIKAEDDKYVERKVTFAKEEVVISWSEWTDLCQGDDKLGASQVFMNTFFTLGFTSTRDWHLSYNVYLYLDRNNKIVRIKTTTGGNKEEPVDVLPMCIHRQFAEEMRKLTQPTLHGHWRMEPENGQRTCST